MGILLYSPVIFGFSIEVYFILLILGTPLYFLFRHLLRKRIANKHKRILVTWITTIVVSFVIYVSFVAAIFFSIERYENYPIRDFDKNGWRSNKDTRYEYSKGIIDSKMLIGKTKVQVRELLGDDGNLDKDDSWCYRLGFVPEIGNIDPDVMCIEFKNGKVVGVEQHNT